MPASMDIEDMTPEQADAYDIYGPPDPATPGYALTCHRHAKSDIPSLTNPHVAALAAERPPRPVLPRPPRKVKKPAPTPAPRRRLKAVPQKPAAKAASAPVYLCTNEHMIAKYEAMTPRQLKAQGVKKTPQGWVEY
jgi:hypothetical protein